MSDRLLNHADPTVQRAGSAVVRSIERATGVLSESRAFMAPDGAAAADKPGPGSAAAGS